MIGPDLRRSSGPSPLLEYFQLEQAAQAGFELKPEVETSPLL